MATFKMKQGDSFAFYANITDSVGLPLIDSVEKLASQIVDTNGNLVGEFTISNTEVSGQYLFKILDTRMFPSNTTLLTDIQFTDGDVTTSSVTMSIQVYDDVTKSTKIGGTL